MENKQIIHIAAEICVIGTLSYLFNKKTSSLQSQIDDLKKKNEELVKQVQNLTMGMDNAFQILQTMKQPSYIPQQPLNKPLPQSQQPLNKPPPQSQQPISKQQQKQPVVSKQQPQQTQSPKKSNLPNQKVQQQTAVEQEIPSMMMTAENILQSMMKNGPPIIGITIPDVENMINIEMISQSSSSNPKTSSGQDMIQVLEDNDDSSEISDELSSLQNTE